MRPRNHHRSCGILREIAKDILECDRLLVDFSVGPFSEQRILGKEVIQLKVTLTDIQQFGVSLSFQDKRGNPATVIAPPAWAVSDPALLAVNPASDGMSATVLASGPIGVGQVTVTADGGPNAGDDPISGILDIEVVSSKATSAVFAPEAPTDQP